MFSKPDSHGSLRIYHMKAVCGGGKSYAMLKHIRENTDGRFIYAVPTIALANEIDARWKKDSAASEGERLQAGELIVIHSDKERAEWAENLRRELEAIVCNPFAKQTALITHELLFSDLFDPNYWFAEVLSGWHIVIDEDPEIVVEPHFQDSSNTYADLGEIARPQCVDEEFTVLDISKAQRNRVREIISGSNNDTRLEDKVRAFCETLVNDRDATVLASPSKLGFLYYLASARPLAQLVAEAGRVTILASHVTSLTRLYLRECGIDIHHSDIRPKYSSYPDELQQRISVWRVWERGNMSAQRLTDYGVSKLLTQIGDQLRAAGNDSDFMVRANDSHHEEAEGCSQVAGVVSKVTKGLNMYDRLTVMVDIASYNRNVLYRKAYEVLDQLLKVSAGTWQSAVEETNSELSAQAAFRIGIRRVHGGLNDETYAIVLPDQRTEDFMRATYLPHAVYRGAMLDDGRQGKSSGRPSGGSTEIAERVGRVKHLILQGFSLRAACASEGISRTTYGKYIK